MSVNPFTQPGSNMIKASLRQLLPAALLLLAAPLHAETVEDGRAWFNLTAEGDLTDRLRWYMELQPRFKQEGREFDQYIARPGINFKLNDHVLVGGGYGYIRTRTNQGRYTDEDRFWQQVIYNKVWESGIKFQSRSRLEQRLVDSGDDTGWRYRQLLRVSKPLAAMPSMSPVLWNEVFFNFRDTDWGAQSGFDQNRLFAGIAWQARPDVRLEFGYLNQYVRGRAADSMNHVLSTGLFLNF